MFDWLTNWIDGGPVGYLVIAGIVAVDSFFPLVPGETAVITGGVLAANGSMALAVVLLAAFGGSLIGDNVSYWAGRTLGTTARRRFFSSEKALHRLAWAEVQLETRGPAIIVAARFVPGGRTATMFASGSLEMPWRRFVAADAVAAGVWALYATALGYFGGETFRHSLFKPLGVAFAIAAVVTLGSEIWRRARLDGSGEEVDRRAERFRRDADGEAGRDGEAAA